MCLILYFFDTQWVEVNMKRNLGMVDRDLRVALSLAIGAIGIYNSSWWGLAALIPLGTAFLGWCPIYVPFGFSTRKAPPEGSSS
jgi:hypothetical protein